MSVIKAGCVDKAHFSTIDSCICSLDILGACGLVRKCVFRVNEGRGSGGGILTRIKLMAHDKPLLCDGIDEARLPCPRLPHNCDHHRWLGLHIHFYFFSFASFVPPLGAVLIYFLLFLLFFYSLNSFFCYCKRSLLFKRCT